MTLNHLSKCLIGSEPLPFERSLPVVKKTPGPTFALVAPQLPKGFFEQIGGVQSLVGPEKAFNAWRPWRLKIVQRDNSAYFCPLMKRRFLLASRPYSLFLT